MPTTRSFPATLRRFAAGIIAPSIALAVLCGQVAAAPLPGRARIARRATPPGIQTFDQARRIDVNRMNMVTTNFGSFAYDLANANAGLVWPKGSNQTAVFASGLWLGCTVNGSPRVTVAEYSQEFGPGAMVGVLPDNPNRPDYIVYKVARWTGNPADSSHVDRSAGELLADPLLDPLLHHSWSEYLLGAAPFGAPTRTYRLPVTTTPDPTDSVDVTGPDVLGDEMLWEVHNDADATLHTNSAGLTQPIGVEVQQTLFAFDRSDDLGNVLFLKFHIANRGGNTLNDLYVSLWSDPDLGTFTDDLVGCDIGRSLGFAYNEQPVDGIYGAPPPALGYVLLRGPLGLANGQPLGMTAFSKYINGTDPSSSLDSYHYMHGLHADGSTVIDPVSGLPTTYFVSGDPVTGTGWLDALGSDRRFLISSGPSRMLPGETQDIWAAMVMGRGLDRISSVATVRCISDLARGVYQQGFSVPASPFPACSTGVTATRVSLVSADASPDHVLLSWYADAAGLSADVERRAPGGEWRAVGRVIADGEGMLRFDDHDVATGARYEYRLAISSAGGVEYLGAATVEIPSDSVLAFLGARAGTGRSPLRVSFSLATREPVRIEVLDVAGRRLVAQDYTHLDPGSHTLMVGEGLRFPSGIYLVRIGQGGRQVTGKAAIIR
jgi:hypothetical protein